MCRQFEETQGRLEAAVEQCALPLALVPGTQVCSLAPASLNYMQWRGAPLGGRKWSSSSSLDHIDEGSACTGLEMPRA